MEKDVFAENPLHWPVSFFIHYISNVFNFLNRRTNQYILPSIIALYQSPTIVR